MKLVLIVKRKFWKKEMDGDVRTAVNFSNKVTQDTLLILK